MSNINVWGPVVVSKLKPHQRHIQDNVTDPPPVFDWQVILWDGLGRKHPGLQIDSKLKKLLCLRMRFIKQYDLVAVTVPFPWKL